MEPKYWAVIPFGLVAIVACGVLWVVVCYSYREVDEEIPLQFIM